MMTMIDFLTSLFCSQGVSGHYTSVRGETDDVDCTMMMLFSLSLSLTRDMYC
jgi:hypothetical protein